MTTLKRALFALLAIVPLLLPAIAIAQDPAPAAEVSTPSNPIAAANKRLEQARQQLADLRVKIEAARENGVRLGELRLEVEQLGRFALEASVSTRERFNQIKARLDEIGPVPAEGQPAESEVIKEERARLSDERAAINALTGNAEELSIETTQLSNEITEMRRTLFTETLLERTKITPEVLEEAIGAGADEGADLQRTVGGWARFVWNFKRESLLAAISLSLVVGLVLYSVGYRLAGPIIQRNKMIEKPHYITRLMVAYWSIMIPTLAVGAFAFACYSLLSSFNVLRPDIAPMVSTLFGVCVGLYFVSALARAVLAPNRPEWRLVNVSNDGARRLERSIFAMALANSLDYFLGTVSVALGSAVVLTVAKSMIASIVIGMILIWISFIRPMLREGEDPATRGRPWPRTLSMLLMLTGFGLIAMAVIGYVGLARFVAAQIVVTGAILVTMYIGILSGRAIGTQGAFARTYLGQRMAERYQLGEVTLDQAGLAASLGIYLIVLLLGLPGILLQWGFQLGDIESWAYQIFTEIRVGSISISLIGILAGVLLFALGLVVTRWFQRWLDGTIMVRSHVDPGVRNSVRTAVGYAGVGLAGLIGISAAGINLSSLALVAGALSLGIGFGLQNIVSNFVSGLILLAERPFKVGDWVVAGTTEGFVKRISVRATEIETFQRQTIIVPNSVLINGQVGNWTHRNKLGRIEIPVSVFSGNDPRQVTELLLEVAATQPVLRNPEPSVTFLGFSALTLDFELRAFVADVLDAGVIKTEMRTAILERLRQDDIALAGPAAPTVPVTMDPESARLLAAMIDSARADVAPSRKPAPKPVEEGADETG
ncbi:mechanosensitive ion channel family protein [Rhizobium sp. TRM96647]|uniref:mechanosensitive ion channel family protein n=1 Tax=unclassified Rhizobium TaxID=2613769 RepID=UPI0021E96284|nr:MULTISPECIES: mechanosensitive ion channel family protein [unclassified Rhizobium]MCV3736979.1 mechanosensitive ion channel family protein [Rhizobium sp. TRM96647]MCV3756621.1 mechanosensitive ion channel family protein [Rhizobium sp. TRM96650]